MLLTPIKSRDLIGAYKRDNLDASINDHRSSEVLKRIDTSQLAVDIWYEVIQLYDSAVHLAFMGGQSRRVTIKTPRLLSVLNHRPSHRPMI